MNTQETAPHFHGEDVIPSSIQQALFHIIPVPFEHSVSYGTGTADGPRAILEASAQLELFTCGATPAEYGIYTAPVVPCGGGPEAVLGQIEKSVSSTLAVRSIPVVLGGEHTVTCGVISALQHNYDDFGVIQFDAHADLRDTYEGSPFSHACVMRRIHEKGVPIFQLGTRSYSLEEHQYRQKHKISFQDSEEIWLHGPDLKLPKDFPRLAYITFDLDCLDSSIMPATGTPVPGGLNWHQVMMLIKQIMAARVCLGFDIVELAPIASLHALSFTAAQLTYNLMAYLTKSPVNRQYWIDAL